MMRTYKQHDQGRQRSGTIRQMPPAASALCIAARVVVDDAERDPHSTVERALPLVADARTAGDDRALALALRAVGIAQRLLGDIAASSERLDEAVVCSQRVGDPNLEADALTSRAGNLFLTGAIDACDSDLARAIEIASGDSLAYALFQRATIANRRGEHETARAGTTGRWNSQSRAARSSTRLTSAPTVPSTSPTTATSPLPMPISRSPASSTNDSA